MQRLSGWTGQRKGKHAVDSLKGIRSLREEDFDIEALSYHDIHVGFCSDPEIGQRRAGAFHIDRELGGKTIQVSEDETPEDYGLALSDVCKSGRR